MPVKKAAPKGVDVSKFLEELVLGRHDDRLAEITPVVGQRVIEARGKIYWRMELPDVSIDRKDVTIAELCRVEQLTGRRAFDLHPGASVTVSRAFVRAALEARCDMTPDEAEAKAGSYTEDEYQDAFDEYVVLPAPLDSALPTTTS